MPNHWHESLPSCTARQTCHNFFSWCSKPTMALKFSKKISLIFMKKYLRPWHTYMYTHEHVREDTRKHNKEFFCGIDCLKQQELWERNWQWCTSRGLGICGGPRQTVLAQCLKITASPPLHHLSSCFWSMTRSIIVSLIPNPYYTKSEKGVG